MSKSIEQKFNDAMCLFSQYCSDSDINKLYQARSEIIDVVSFDASNAQAQQLLHDIDLTLKTLKRK